MDYKDEYLTFWKYELGTPEAEEAWARKVEMMERMERGDINAPQVMSEEKLYKAYRSMQTGEVVEGRAKHRKHLKAHGLVEVGNEQPKAPKKMESPEGLKQELIRQFYN